MSAYICNPEQFGILAAYAVTRRDNCAIYEWRGANKIETAQAVAKGLARENIRSVAHRYPDDKDGNRPGPCLLDAEIEEAAALYAAHFVKHPQHLTPVQVLKLCRAVDYQSCETNDWKDTLAWRQLDWITGDAIRSLPGYDGADWNYGNPVPEIDALYARSAA